MASQATTSNGRRGLSRAYPRLSGVVIRTGLVQRIIRALIPETRCSLPRGFVERMRPASSRWIATARLGDTPQR
jgi:hypothetical protein